MKPLAEHSDVHLLERYQSLSRNLFFQEGKLYCPRELRESLDATHAEITMRGLEYRTEVEDWIRPTDKGPVFHRSSLVRYSKRSHLSELIAGTVSLGPAAIYDKQFNLAQRDDETARKWHLPNTVLNIGGVEYPASDLVLSHEIRITGLRGNGYHLLSLSNEESPKLQRAFAAEGYVLILNFDGFYETILSALRKRIDESLGLEFRRVRYYDDLEEPKFEKPSDVLFSKPIHFQYQHESRLVVYGAPRETERFEIQVAWPQGIFSEIRTF